MAKTKLYILKVALSHQKRTWRRIEILGSQTLDHLHNVVFFAFDRYDHHMYSFYMTKAGSKARDRFANAPEYTHPYALDTVGGLGMKKLHDATKAKLSSLNLQVKSKFEYLFDFGDEWLHEVTVEKILDVYPKADYPLITKVNGESPPQYPEYDEDDDEYDDGDHGDDGALIGSYEDFEAECDKIREENKEVLAKFENYLASKKLSEKTIKKHFLNIDFYINEFLLYEEPLRPRHGVRQLDYFLGYWFIRKALWSSVSAIKEYISSLKRFYTFMQEDGRIDLQELTEMKAEIKESKDEWFATMRKYDDPDVDMEDVSW